MYDKEPDSLQNVLIVAVSVTMKDERTTIGRTYTNLLK